MTAKPTWHRIGAPEGVTTAFDDRVTFTSSSELVVATTFRVENTHNAFTLPAIAHQSPAPLVLKVDANDFRCIYGHADEHLLKMTARWSGLKIEGQMHPRTDCSRTQGVRKGIPHT